MDLQPIALNNVAAVVGIMLATCIVIWFVDGRLWKMEREQQQKGFAYFERKQ